MLKSESYCSREKTFSSSGGNLITKCIFQKQNFMYEYIHPVAPNGLIKNIYDLTQLR